MQNITLKGDQDESEVHMGLDIATLGKDKAILYWGEDCKGSTFVKIGTVNLETCKMNVVKIDDPKRDLLLELLATNQIVTYNDDSFDIFMYDLKRFGDKLVKIPVNADGTAKDEPTDTNIKAGMIIYLSPIATRSSSKGYAAVRDNKSQDTLMLIKPDGSEKELDKYNKTSLPVYSAGENAVSSCVKMNADSGVTCKQFDEDGKVKYTTTIADANKNIHPKAVHNFRDGGMLVMLAQSIGCNEDLVCNDSKYQMVKIAADGKILGTVRNDEFESVSGLYRDTYVYEFGNSKYCAAILGESSNTFWQKQSGYEILYDCVTEDEFKV